MAVILAEEENVGCVIYKIPGQTEERFVKAAEIITLETPFYKDNSNYTEWASSPGRPLEGTLVEGISKLHFYTGGEKREIDKMALYRPAAEVVCQILAEKANRYERVPFDEESKSGKESKKEYVDLISLFLIRWRRENKSLRVPLTKIPLDPDSCADAPPLLATIGDDEFGRVIDRIRNAFQSQHWAVSRVLALDSLVTLFV